MRRNQGRRYDQSYRSLDQRLSAGVDNIAARGGLLIIRLFSAFSCLASASGCAHSSNSDVRPIQQFVDATASHGARAVLIGEIHGTNEVPGFFFDLVDRLSRDGRPLAVGLEMPPDVVRAGCPAEGGPAAVFWKQAQDGRTSLAMRSLVCRLEVLAARRNLELFGFAGDEEQGGGLHPFVAPIRQKAQGAGRALVLVGNYHSRRGAPGSLASGLADAGVAVLTLTASSPSYGAWACQGMGDCGSRQLGASFCKDVEPPPEGATVATQPGIAWDGCAVFARTTPSPPAFAASGPGE